MKVFFNNSCKICRSEINLYKKENIKFFDRNLFNKMQKHSIFINTSRGCLIDEASLIEALSNKKISSAAVDVIEDEKNVQISE